ncbi:MAG TPA: hypothetical protein V6C89_09510 [Drouetiella sp.]|jgi:hypothetical protein
MINDLSNVPLRSDAVRRAEFAKLVPFFLRNWWLRDRHVNDGMEFGVNTESTLPLFAVHSDPVCDATCIDMFEL